jgi:hypothetical protein
LVYRLYQISEWQKAAAEFLPSAEEKADIGYPSLSAFRSGTYNIVTSFSKFSLSGSRHIGLS